MQTHMLLVSLAKVILLAVAMTSLYPLFLVIADPIYSWCESAGIGRGIGGIGWILDPAIRAVAIFIVSLLFGALFPRDRRIVRFAVTISVLWVLLWATVALIHLSSVGHPEEVSLYTRSWIIPFVCVAVVVVLLSPFVHDCGRVLRNYLQRRMPQHR